MKKLESDVNERFNQQEIDKICIFFSVRKILSCLHRAILLNFHHFPQEKLKRTYSDEKEIEQSSEFNKFHVWKSLFPLVEQAFICPN